MCNFIFIWVEIKQYLKMQRANFFQSLSMQALSKSDNSILKFDAINRPNKSISSLLVNETLAYENAQIEKNTKFL